MLKILLHKGNGSIYFDAVSVALAEEDHNKVIIFTTMNDKQIKFSVDEETRERRNEQTVMAFRYLMDKAKMDDSEIITLSDRFFYTFDRFDYLSYMAAEPIPF